MEVVHGARAWDWAGEDWSTEDVLPPLDIILGLVGGRARHERVVLVYTQTTFQISKISTPLGDDKRGMQKLAVKFLHLEEDMSP